MHAGASEHADVSAGYLEALQDHISSIEIALRSLEGSTHGMPRYPAKMHSWGGRRAESHFACHSNKQACYVSAVLRWSNVKL